MSPKNVLVSAVLIAAAAGIARSEGPALAPAGVLTVTTDLSFFRIPIWSGDALVSIEGSIPGPHAFVVYAPTGEVLLDAVFSVAGTQHTSVRSWARGADGSVAVCGTSFDRDGRSAPFIAMISADGASQHIIRTEPFYPHLVTVAADGSLWAVGRNLNSHRGEEGVDPNAGVLRHFDRSGRPLGAYLLRSTFKNPVELNELNGILRPLQDGVAWIHYLSNGDGSYTEVSSRGEVTSYPIPSMRKDQSDEIIIRGMAVTPANDVFASMYLGGKIESGSIFWLDREKRRWLPVTQPAGIAGAIVFGANGSGLVLPLIGDSPSTFHFFNVAP